MLRSNHCKKGTSRHCKYINTHLTYILLINCYFCRLNARDSQASRSTSVAPSDSISRFDSDGRTSRSGQSTSFSGRNVPLHQPVTRPSNYPVEVLWSLDDCRDDPDIHMSATNTSRPPLEQAIHHSDGTMITTSEWAAIKATARMVKSDLLSLPPSRDRRAKD
jgi:hypothetical protein